MSKLLAAALAAGVLWAAAQDNPAATHITADDPDQLVELK